MRTCSLNCLALVSSSSTAAANFFACMALKAIVADFDLVSSSRQAWTAFTTSLYALNAFMAAIISASEAVLPSGIVAGALGKGHSAWAENDSPSDTSAAAVSRAFIFILDLTVNRTSKRRAFFREEGLEGLIGGSRADLSPFRANFT